MEPASDTFARLPATTNGTTTEDSAAAGDQQSRERRQEELEGDEDFARQLAAQLSLMSPAEHGAAESKASGEENPPSRIGGGGATSAPISGLGSAGSAAGEGGRGGGELGADASGGELGA